MLELILFPLLSAISLLLLWVTFAPLLPEKIGFMGQKPIVMPAQTDASFSVGVYRTILVPLDHSEKDHLAVSHAATIAKQHNAEVILMHVEEDVTSQLYGKFASTAEVQAGRQYLEKIAAGLAKQSIVSRTIIYHSSNPADQIIAAAKELKPDLVIMSSHGHKLIGDIVRGHTINHVRHALEMPLLIVK